MNEGGGGWTSFSSPNGIFWLEPFHSCGQDQQHSEARQYAALDFKTHQKPAQMLLCYVPGTARPENISFHLSLQSALLCRPLAGKGAEEEESTDKAWKASESNEKNTSLCTHGSFSVLPVWACARSWKAHSLKSWPLKGMYLGLKCQRGCAPSVGHVFFSFPNCFIYLFWTW